MFDWDDGSAGTDMFNFQMDDPNDPTSPYFDPNHIPGNPSGSPFVQDHTLGVGDTIGGILGGIGDALEGLGDAVGGILGGDLGDLLQWGLENGFLEGSMGRDEDRYTASIRSPLNGNYITVSVSASHWAVYIE